MRSGFLGYNYIKCPRHGLSGQVIKAHGGALMENIITKKCTKCKIVKPSNKFNKDRKKPDGLFTWCKACSIEHARKYRLQHPEVIKLYRIVNKEKLIKSSKDYNRNRKITTMNAYGGKCVCCGEDKIEFLAIDHIGGGGQKEIKQMGGQAYFYSHLKKMGWPPGYRVLCHNCNMAIGFYGKCPHEII